MPSPCMQLLARLERVESLAGHLSQHQESGLDSRQSSPKELPDRADAAGELAAHSALVPDSPGRTTAEQKASARSAPRLMNIQATLWPARMLHHKYPHRSDILLFDADNAAPAAGEALPQLAASERTTASQVCSLSDHSETLCFN